MVRAAGGMRHTPAPSWRRMAGVGVARMGPVVAALPTALPQNGSAARTAIRPALTQAGEQGVVRQLHSAEGVGGGGGGSCAGRPRHFVRVGSQGGSAKGLAKLPAGGGWRETEDTAGRSFVHGDCDCEPVPCTQAVSAGSDM
eukprot:CAMPEP_0182923786 /NCGR_PEP_ID=MMETSP0105_2-20130417/5650_1 /TAXON_ID=81532 ORGANISM="Acanthoeca-like sp., Strain 10tr" /NCGR_SAMPLE_ID=MMETSP0105_2 /ASSEMBLY_ACC=CAM_ASM_000205 /LENGTH=141 /DNA_ID=CAMNT_0025061519 /DNA_START=487 /DNA_END=913 /DNA_ORIENTATION=+